MTRRWTILGVRDVRATAGEPAHDHFGTVCNPRPAARRTLHATRAAHQM